MNPWIKFGITALLFAAIGGGGFALGYSQKSAKCEAEVTGQQLAITEDANQNQQTVIDSEKQDERIDLEREQALDAARRENNALRQALALAKSNGGENYVACLDVPLPAGVADRLPDANPD